MLTAFLFTALSGIAGFIVALSLLLSNEYFFDSGHRAPTTTDFFIFVSLVILPVAGLQFGFQYARRTQLELSSPIFIAVIAAIVALTIYCGLLQKLIHERNIQPPAQANTAADMLVNTSWGREALPESTLKELSASLPMQIMKISFSRDESSSCSYGQTYTAELISGNKISNCWQVSEDGKSLILVEDGMKSYYQDLTISSTMMEFRRLPQTWKFKKELSLE